MSKTIELLNKALADEWLAYFQYWAGSKVISGPMRVSIQEELEEHAEEELKHANMIAERIIQLGGEPIVDPKKIFELSNCEYDVPEPSVKVILQQNVKAEQCAIDVYTKLAELTKDDPVTQKMVIEILEDEYEHKTDLNAFLEDIRDL